MSSLFANKLVLQGAQRAAVLVVRSRAQSGVGAAQVFSCRNASRITAPPDHASLLPLVKRIPGCLVAFIARVLLSANTRATDKPLTVSSIAISSAVPERLIVLALLGVAALNRTLAADCNGLLRRANVVEVR